MSSAWRGIAIRNNSRFYISAIVNLVLKTTISTFTPVYGLMKNGEVQTGRVEAGKTSGMPNSGEYHGKADGQTQSQTSS